MAAVLYVLFSVLVWSFLPLLGALVIEKVNIWNFLLWTQLAGVIFSGILLHVKTAHEKDAHLKLKNLGDNMHGGFALVGLTYILSLGCMWTSFFYISKAGATIIYDMWPLLSMFMTPILVEKAWRKLPARNFVYAILALVGVAFILRPELEAQFFVKSAHPLKAWFVLFLPLFGGAFMAISSVVKARLSNFMETPDNLFNSKLTVQTYSLMYGFIFAGIFALMHLASGSTQHDVYDEPTIILILLIGIVIYVLGSLSYVIGLLKSPKSNIIVLWYFTPLLSIFWLSMAGLADITPYIIIGTAAIICTNLLTAIRAEQRVSYSATIISLLMVGITCYFVPSHEMGDYYQAVSVPLTFYAIIVAFLMDRIIKRDTFEEELAISVIKHIQEEAGGKRADSVELIGHVTSMLQTNNTAKIAGHYEYLRNDVSAMQPVQEKLDALILSKVEGVNFSEILVLSMIGLLTIAMTVFYRPPDFIADCFAIVLTTAIAFIFFMVIDLVNKRAIFNLKADENGRFTLADGAISDGGSEVVIATIMIVAVIAAFIYLVWVKHHGWFEPLKL